MVVKGTLEVTKDGKVDLISENQSTYIHIPTGWPIRVKSRPS
jgi:hypothetical protein